MQNLKGEFPQHLTKAPLRVGNVNKNLTILQHFVNNFFMGIVYNFFMSIIRPFSGKSLFTQAPARAPVYLYTHDPAIQNYKPLVNIYLNNVTKCVKNIKDEKPLTISDRIDFLTLDNDTASEAYCYLSRIKSNAPSVLLLDVITNPKEESNKRIAALILFYRITSYDSKKHHMSPGYIITIFKNIFSNPKENTLLRKYLIIIMTKLSPLDEKNPLTAEINVILIRALKDFSENKYPADIRETAAYAIGNMVYTTDLINLTLEDLFINQAEPKKLRLAAGASITTYYMKQAHKQKVISDFEKLITREKDPEILAMADKILYKSKTEKPYKPAKPRKTQEDPGGHGIYQEL